MDNNCICSMRTRKLKNLKGKKKIHKIVTFGVGSLGPRLLKY